MSLCICFHLLTQEASSMLTRLGTDILYGVQWNIITSYLIDFFFFNQQRLVLSYVSSLWFLVTKKCQLWFPPCGVGLKPNEATASSGHHCPRICKDDRLWIRDSVTGLVSMFLFQQLAECLSAPMRLEHMGEDSMQAPTCLLHVQWVLQMLSCWQQPRLFGEFQGTFLPTTQLNAVQSHYWKPCLATRDSQLSPHQHHLHKFQEVSTALVFTPTLKCHQIPNVSLYSLPQPQLPLPS